MKAYVILADGFEEIEGLTTVDILRRAKINVTTISIMDRNTVEGSHGIIVEADEVFENDTWDDADILILPGGGRGTENLTAHKGLRRLLPVYTANDKKLAAICAAPSVLGVNGLLAGKHCTCFPGFEDKLKDAYHEDKSVVVDGNIITGRAMGASLDFALAILGELLGQQAAENMRRSVYYMS